ncbi:acyl-CoA thioesterase [Pseudoalteromonas sp. T1lg22]|uniref:acyl-CoA thioesterase n=1 Tax=Pseudoalteromonas sp. T1lg22 TaxID=2077096 RepID=UPI000CF5E78F|nr:thioesterase family protein [Pseudoalteromonas sp. T1lg22]
MTFDQLMALVSEKDTQTLQFPETWTQGRTAFGGLSCAFALQSMLLHCHDERTLRSFSAQFVGPIAPDEPFTLSFNLLREGKNSSQYAATITQHNQVCLTVQGLFAKDRASIVEVPYAQLQGKQAPNADNCLPFVQGVMPNFFQYVDLNLVAGGMPYSSSQATDLSGWMRFKEQTQDYDWTHLIALIDSWPPSQLQIFPSPAPASSMSWHVECLHLPKLSAGDWVGVDITTTAAHNGYAYEDATLYTESGDVIAQSKQTVALFA